LTSVVWKIVAAVVVAVGCVVGCVVVFTQDDRGTPASRPTGVTPAPKSDLPIVVITGNEHGFIRPCGCSKPALGGVHRRAHAIAELKEAEPKLAALSLGEFLNETNRQQEIKFESFLLSLTEMNYAAFVPGAGEFKLGKRFLSDARGMTPVPFVVANAEYPGELPFEKSAPLADTGGVVIGLVPSLPAELGVTVTPAAAALATEAKAAQGAAFLIVAYNGPADDLPKLAEAVPEDLRKKTTFAIPGFADAPIALPPAGGIPVVTAGTKGRNIGLLRPLSGKPYEFLRLEEARPGAPAVVSILDSYRKAVKDEGLMRNVARTPGAAKYVGDKRCSECHQAAHETLSTTPHQRALKALKDTADEYDPECIRCHVTGWAMETGFVDFDLTPTHVNVNCEACHGPGSEHSNNNMPTLGGKVDLNTCVRCHDPDNSPQFKFEKYWPRIEHK
jgi:hypothetical protein